MSILSEDIKNIISNFDMSVFKDKTVFVTGATGLIGKLCVMSLLKNSFNTKVVALIRNKQKADSIFPQNQNLEYVVQDITSKIKYNGEVDYIIHCASNTASSDFASFPVETIDITINGTKNVLEFAKEKKVKSLVYISSIEMYGKKEQENTKEDDYGYIDVLNTRSCYSESKRMAETLCISYGSEYNLPVKIARLSQIVGAGINNDDNRVFSQFAKAVINKENIILHTTGESKKNYCYTTDAVRGIFTILIKGQNNNAYNVANKNNYYSIAQTAKLLENDFTKVVFEIDDKNRGYNVPSKICLDTQKLEELGWSAQIELDEILKRLVDFFKENAWIF